MSRNLSNKKINKVGNVNMSNVVIVSKKEKKKIMCYEIERNGQVYILNVIASKDNDKITSEILISKKNDDFRACKWHGTHTSVDSLKYTNFNVEACANYIVNAYANEMIDYFEEETECMYSYDRVKNDMKYWAEECAKEGYTMMHSHFVQQKNHIKNSQELKEVSNFIETLNGIEDPIKFYNDLIVLDSNGEV